ncbi:hypothetical protein [Pseudomonas hunanensis]|uniref:hypothetical protein n=1 Tax=Pseudomonas hunanensis TaxID=1247546 RepID=UPI0030DBBDC8
MALTSIAIFFRVSTLYNNDGVNTGHEADDGDNGLTNIQRLLAGKVAVKAHAEGTDYKNNHKKTLDEC